jgi:hypothetical protein
MTIGENGEATVFLPTPPYLSHRVEAWDPIHLLIIVLSSSRGVHWSSGCVRMLSSCLLACWHLPPTQPAFFLWFSCPRGGHHAPPTAHNLQGGDVLKDFDASFVSAQRRQFWVLYGSAGVPFTLLFVVTWVWLHATGYRPHRMHWWVYRPWHPVLWLHMDMLKGLCCRGGCLCEAWML